MIQRNDNERVVRSGAGAGGWGFEGEGVSLVFREKAATAQVSVLSFKSEAADGKTTEPRACERSVA